MILIITCCHVHCLHFSLFYIFNQKTVTESWTIAITLLPVVVFATTVFIFNLFKISKQFISTDLWNFINSGYKKKKSYFVRDSKLTFHIFACSSTVYIPKSTNIYSFHTATVTALFTFLTTDFTTSVRAHDLVKGNYET